VQFLVVEEKPPPVWRRVRRESVSKSRGWTVRGIMAHVWKQRGVSRSFPRRAGKASLCALQRLALWKRLNRWYPLGLCRECFNARTNQKKKPRNPINKLLAFQYLIRLLPSNQSRPKSSLHARSSGQRVRASGRTLGILHTHAGTHCPIHLYTDR
jgi:hypothetical protein